MKQLPQQPVHTPGPAALSLANKLSAARGNAMTLFGLGPNIGTSDCIGQATPGGPHGGTSPGRLALR